MRVYIAGPYTIGDPAINVRHAIMAGDHLLRRGHTPFIPHLSHFWHYLFPHQYQTWIDYTLEWLKVCGAVVRLKGESEGADQEVAFAHAKGIPVFASTDEFLDWYQQKFPSMTDPKHLTRILDANSSGPRK